MDWLTFREHKDFALSIGCAAMGVVFVVNVFVHPLVVLLLLVASIALLLVEERPTMAVWLSLLLTPVESIGPMNFTLTKFVKLALAALIAIVLCVYSWPTKGAPPKDAYRWPFFLVLFSAIPATLLAGSPLNSAMGLLSLLIFVLYYTGIRRSQVLAPHGPLLLKILLAAAILTSVLCISQMTWGYTGFFGSAEQQIVDAEQGYDTIFPTFFRASGTFNGPNAAGAFLAIGMVVGVSQVLSMRSNRVLYCLGALLCGLGVLTTFSRGALLGAIVGTMFASSILLRWSRPRMVALIALLAVFVGAVLISEQARSYLRIGADIISTSPTRVDAWQAALTLVRRNPVFGIGFYEFHAAAQGISGTTETPLHPHNGPLKALVEQGPVGLLGYLLFVVTFLRTAKKSVGDAVKGHDRWVFGAIAGIGASLFTQELFDAGFSLGSSSLAILFAALLGLQASLSSKLENNQNQFA